MNLRSHAVGYWRLLLAIALFAAGGVITAIHAAKSDPPEGMNLLFSSDFEDGNTAAWEPTDRSVWKAAADGQNKVYALTGKSDYKPEVRSPLSYSLLKGVIVKDFVFEVKMRSTTKDYDHRDLCVIFGWKDPSHFYYAHFALKSDDHANSIFLVNGSPRVSIAKTRSEGTRWSESYHTVRVERKVETGEILIFFDNLDEPVMTAEDKTLLQGQVGVGSFDDTGHFDDIKLWGEAVPPSEQEPAK